MQTINLSMRIDKALKEQAEAFLEDLGMPLSTAVSVFLRQVVRQRRIPFELALDDDLYFSDEMMKRIEESRAQ